MLAALPIFSLRSCASTSRSQGSCFSAASADAAIPSAGAAIGAFLYLQVSSPSPASPFRSAARFISSNSTRSGRSGSRFRWCHSAFCFSPPGQKSSSSAACSKTCWPVPPRAISRVGGSPRLFSPFAHHQLGLSQLALRDPGFHRRLFLRLDLAQDRLDFLLPFGPRRRRHPLAPFLSHSLARLS